MCVFIGVVLHYVFLAAFMWMTIEGHHLYHMLVKVFHSGRDFTRIYFTLGYGVPAIIVAITGIVTACLQDTGYGNDDMYESNKFSFVVMFSIDFQVLAVSTWLHLGFYGPCSDVDHSRNIK